MSNSTASKLRGQILSANDLGKEDVTIPEWDNAVIQVRGLGVTEYAKVLKQSEVDEVVEIDVSDGKGGTVAKSKTIKVQDADRLAVLLVIACSHDPASGDKLFTVADMDPLGEKHGGLIGKVAKVALRLCGNDEAQAEKNSEKTPTTGSPSE